MKSIEKENPEYKMRLHPRLGQYVIDITLKSHGETVTVHEETSYQRAEGVFWYLYGNPHILHKEAEQRIAQRHSG